jgi:Bacterial membrane protein YfhO
MRRARPDFDDPRAGLARRVGLGIALVAAVVFVVGTVGPPLFGRGVFLGSDTIFQAYPWRAFESAGDLGATDNGPISDTVDSVYPAREAFATHARDGQFLSWNPWVAGGIPAGVNSSGVLDPFALVFLVVPAWLAPALIKALQLGVSAGFTFLFCRRLGVERPAAVFAGLAFAGSGFMVMWSNWQQTDVAALVPVLFWATERFLQKRTVSSAVPIAIALAGMLAGVFPAIVFYAAYLLVPYVVVRVLTERDRPLLARVRTGSGVGVALGAGVLLAAAVVLPFLSRSGDLDLTGRHQTPSLNLNASSLITTIAPKAMGLSTESGADWFGRFNQVEGLSFIGVTTVLLALAALCLPKPSGTPTGVRPVLAISTLIVGLGTYGGGTMLSWLQTLPAFDNSFIGRTRSVLGFAVAVLAGIGAQAVLERRRPQDLRRWLMAGAVTVAFVVIAARVWQGAHGRADAADHVGLLNHEVGVAGLIALAAVGCAVAMWARRPLLRYGGVAAMTVLLVVEALALARPLLPNEDISTLYPETPASRFLDGAIGDGRMAVEGRTFFGNSVAMAQHRSVTGHAFHTTTWKEALLTIDPHAFDASSTFSMLSSTRQVLTSPFLDRLGVNVFGAVPDREPLGERTPTSLVTDSCERGTSLDGGTPQQLTLAPGEAQALRGVVLQVCDDVELPHDASLVGRVQAADGSAAEGRLELPDVTEREELSLALPAEQLAGEVTVTLALEGADGRSLPVSATPFGQVAADAIQATDDGLDLVYAHDLLIYERTSALPRIRWASGATVVPDLVDRLTVLAHGTADDDTVVLNDEPRYGEGDGLPAEVKVTEDGPTGIEAEVNAQGEGFLVVADAIQSGWTVEVDGRRAELMDADHAGVAVRVPEGRHTVTLRYTPGGWRLGQILSALTILGLAGVVIWDVMRRRRPAVGSVGPPEPPAAHLARPGGNHLRLPLPAREPTSKT